MNIGVDLRALGGEKVSGVKIYISSLLQALTKLDQKNHYFLWWNSAEKKIPSELKIPSSPRFRLIHTRFSNRILNLKILAKNSDPLDKLILASEARSEKLDAFFLPNPNPVILSPHCRLITTIHDLSPTLYPQFFSAKTRLWHQFLNPEKIAQNSDHILTPSNATKKDLTEHWGIPPEKITSTPLAAPANSRKTPLEKLRQKYHLPEKFILSLSTLEPRKNLPTLIKAFRELKSELKIPHELVLAGEPDPRIFANPKIGVKTPRRGVSNPRTNSGVKKTGIKFLSFVAEKDKSALLSAADVFCFPSFYEGFGLPPLEAMSVGTAVLAADIPSLREVCGNAAKFIPPKNVDAWKIALQKILSNDELREDLGQRGLAQANKFSWEDCARKTIEVFEKACNSPF